MSQPWGKMSQHKVMSLTKQNNDINKIVSMLQLELDSRDINIWDKIARENQKIPICNWDIWLLLAGRGFGKTRTAAEAIRKWARCGKFKRIALIANTIDEAKKVMIEGESGILSISTINENIKYYPSKNILKWPNDTCAYIFSAENYEKLRGFQFDCVWIDEIAKFRNHKEVFQQVVFCLRLSNENKMIITTTPRPLTFLKELINKKNVITTYGSSFENEKNLSQQFIEELKYLKDTKFGQQEIFAKIIDNNENLFWNEYDIIQKDLNIFFKKTVVAIDPAMSFHDQSNETGIIFVGIDFNDVGYVINDLSTNKPPELWLDGFIENCIQYNVQTIVIETNSGGIFLKKFIQQYFDNHNIENPRHLNVNAEILSNMSHNNEFNTTNNNEINSINNNNVNILHNRRINNNKLDFFKKNECGILYNNNIQAVDDNYLNNNFKTNVNKNYSTQNCKSITIDTDNSYTKKYLQLVNQLTFKDVHAHVSKERRAIDILLLYKKKKIIHLNKFFELENQMIQFPSGNKDRVDALVWGFRELFFSDYKLEVQPNCFEL